MANTCSYCGALIPDGTGTRVIKDDDKVMYNLCSRDCFNQQARNFNLGDCFKVTGFNKITCDEWKKCNDTGQRLNLSDYSDKEIKFYA